MTRFEGRAMIIGSVKRGASALPDGLVSVPGDAATDCARLGSLPQAGSPASR